MQLRPKRTGWCKLEGNFTIWFPVTGGDSKRRTDHHFHLCVFFIRSHFSAHPLYNPSSAEFSFSGWKAGLLISLFVCSDRLITPLSPTASVLSSEKVQTPLNFQWWMQKNLSLICLPMLGRASWSGVRCLGTLDHWTLCQDRSVMMNKQHLPLECSARSLLASGDTKVLCKWYIGLSGKFENVSSILLLNSHPWFTCGMISISLWALVYTMLTENLKDELLVVYMCILSFFSASDTSTPEPSEALDQPLGLSAVRIKKSGINDWKHLYMTENVALFYSLCAALQKKSFPSVKRQPALIIDCCCPNSFCLLSGVLLTLPGECHHQNSLDGRCIFQTESWTFAAFVYTQRLFTGVIQLM